MADINIERKRSPIWRIAIVAVAVIAAIVNKAGSALPNALAGVLKDDIADRRGTDWRGHLKLQHVASAVFVGVAGLHFMLLIPRRLQQCLPERLGVGGSQAEPCAEDASFVPSTRMRIAQAVIPQFRDIHDDAVELGCHEERLPRAVCTRWEWLGRAMTADCF